MKRLIAMVMVLCMMFTAALAEEEQPKSVWDSIGGWFSQAWKDTTAWVSQAWADASKWVGQAWGDVSKWVEQAWNDSAKWVTDIWGDVSAWATGTPKAPGGSEENWWKNTFNEVTGNAENPWKWLTEEAGTMQPEYRMLLSGIREAAAPGSGTAEKVKTVFIAIGQKLKLSDGDTQKVWDTVEAYAKEKGIDPAAATRLSLPYLLQLAADRAEAGGSIPAVAVAQYLVAVDEKMNVNSTEQANQLTDQLNAALAGI